MENLKSHFYCVLSERLLLFSVESLSYTLALQSLDFLYEWNMMKNGKIVGNTRCINDFLAKTITDYRIGCESFAKDSNMRLFYFNMDNSFGNLSTYMEDSDVFGKKIQRFCKKYLCNGKTMPMIKNKELYDVSKYDEMNIFSPKGEDLEKIMKRLTKK